MKIKAAITDGAPRELVDALNNSEFAQLIFEEVIQHHLHAGEMGPAGFYIQKCDRTVDQGNGFGCEVRLSGVSVTDERCRNDFFRALDALHERYAMEIQKNLTEGMKIQLFVSLMLDKPIKGADGALTTLLEHEAVWQVRPE